VNHGVTLLLIPVEGDLRGYRGSHLEHEIFCRGKRAVAEGFGIRERDSHFLESHGVHSSSELLPVTWKYSTEDAMIIMSACWHGPVPSGPFVSLALKLE